MVLSGERKNIAYAAISGLHETENEANAIK